MNGDDKGVGGWVGSSMGNVGDMNNGVRGGKGGKRVGIGETCSENVGNMADSATSENSDKDCVASICNTENFISEG